MIRRIAALALGLVAAAGGAVAQGFDMARSSAKEVQVFADDGIDWLSDGERVIAHGHAKATRGTATVNADTLTAHYRKTATGGNEIWRIDADGHVTATTPSDTAAGDKGIYDLDKAILILKGAPAKLTTATQIFTAHDTLEYWENEKMAVLRGNASAEGKGRKIQADTLTAHFKDRGPRAGSGAKPAAKDKGSDTGGDLELKTADAFGHVIITTQRDVVTGDRGTYNAETGIATVSGAVTLSREGNELKGAYAHVDLNTGISRLFGAAPGAEGDDRRAHGTFTPKRDGGTKGKPGAVFSGTAPAGADGSDGGDQH